MTEGLDKVYESGIAELFVFQVRRLMDMGIEESVARQFVIDTMYGLTKIHEEQLEGWDTDDPISLIDYFEYCNSLIYNSM